MGDRICGLVGVGPGLGLAIARQFGQHGYRIAMLARRPEALATYQQSLAEQGVDAQGFSEDVSDAGAIASAFEQIRQTLGHPDVLIYNAAVMKATAAMDIASEDLLQEFKINVAGALISAQQVVPHMREQRSGTLLFTGGGLALEPYPQLASLAIGKSGLRSLCFTLAKELGDEGIHVAMVTICGTVAPGTHFDPEQIAAEYWRLHTQEPAAWEREVVY